MKNNESQIEVLKELVKSQQEYIKQLEQRTSFQDTDKTDINRLMAEYAARLDEVTALRDHYRQMVAEISQIKSEYESSLNELLSSIRSYK